MGKMARKKKKGRPPKSDLPDRSVVSASREPEVRRSTRCRSITYVEDFYDDLFDDEEDEDDDEEEERRREKKVKLVRKIPPSYKKVNSVSRIGGGRGGGRSVEYKKQVSAPESEEASEEDDNKPFKKRKIEKDDEFSVKEDNSDDEDDVKSVRSIDKQIKNLKTNGVCKVLDSAQVQPQGKLFDSSKLVGLPDKPRLGLILDKLQKKDTYGVYAEPVDPEELPDYHDVIDHPMDFGTVRKKLAKGAYSNLDEFENDVDLICTNAMHYNAPETIYFKQARSIQELARKKFERLRIEFENNVAEVKSEEIIKLNSIVRKPIEENIKPNSIVKKPIEENIKPNFIVKKPIKKSCKTIQEPVGSDFSSGATLATPGDICALSNVTVAMGCDKSNTVDGQVDGISSLTESKPEKIEEQLSGKGFPTKLGRKLVMLDENRRGTYNILNQTLVRTESMYTIYDGENKQLVSVGLHTDHSYARSLARFAATLGPVAWKVASQIIEQALPPEIKFGRGWVGEYEPLPTHVLMLENCAHKQSVPGLPSVTSKKDGKIVAKSRKDEKIVAKSMKDHKIVMEMKAREHEPHPMPGQIVENQTQWQSNKGSHNKDELRKDKFAEGSEGSHNKDELRKDKFAEGSKVSKNDMQPGIRIINSSGLAVSCKLQDPAKGHFTTASDGKLGFLGVSGSKSITNASYQQQSPKSMNNARPDNMALKQVELQSSSPGFVNPHGNAPQNQVDHNSEMRTSRLLEVVSRNRNLVQSVPFKQSENDGVAAGRLPHGKTGSSSNNHQVSSLPYVGSNQQVRAAMYFPHVKQEQGLSDPVQMMRMLAEKNQNNQKSLNLVAINGAQSTSDPSPRTDDSNAAATAASRAWMTLGATHFKPPDSSGSTKMQIAASSLYNSAREVSQSVLQNREEAPVSRVQQHCDNNKLPPRVFLPQTSRAGNESRFLANRQMVFPELVTTDLSRFQGQSPWPGLVAHTQPSKKQDTLPPDLNISFQSPLSPVGQSSSAMVDSQQPDLALQL